MVLEGEATRLTKHSEKRHRAGRTVNTCGFWAKNPKWDLSIRGDVGLPSPLSTYEDGKDRPIIEAKSDVGVSSLDLVEVGQTVKPEDRHLEDGAH